MKIQAGVDPLEVKQRLGVGDDEALRESERRRRYLEGFARLITPVRPSLKLTGGIPTAMVNQEDADEPKIYVTTNQYDQPATDYSERVYDLIIQEALTVHEIGHVLYTDGPDTTERIEAVDESRRSMFKRTWNTLEDAAIEEQLRAEFDVEDEILVLNGNLFEQDDIGFVVGEEGEEVTNISFSFFQAVILGLMDMGVYDSGKFERLLDRDDDVVHMAADADTDLLESFLPEMRAVVETVKTEPVSKKRNDAIVDFWESLEEHLDEAENSGESESGLSDLLGADGTIGAGGESGGETDDDGQDSPIEGKPDDSSAGGSNAEEAWALGMGQTGERVQAQVRMASGGEPGADDGEESGADRLRAPDAEHEHADDESGSGGDSDDGDEGDESDAGASGLEEEYQQEIAQEAHALDGGEALLNEVEQFLDIMEAAGNGAGNEWRGLSMDVPQADDYDEEMWAAVQRRGKRIARILRNRFEESKDEDTIRNRSRGRLDQRGMIRGARGQVNIFNRQQDSEKKEYDCILVLDRSGSMGGNTIRQAELAMGALAYAFELLGINVCVMDLHRSEARLAHAFGQSMEDTRGVLFSGSTAGGTPLAQVLHLARKRVQGQNSNPFMVVVTDGRPGDTSAYIDELDNCTFPVLGVYLGGRTGHDDYFHRLSTVEGDADIDSAMLGLAEEVIDGALVDLSRGVNF